MHCPQGRLTVPREDSLSPGKARCPQGRCTDPQEGSLSSRKESLLLWAAGGQQSRTFLRGPAAEAPGVGGSWLFQTVVETAAWGSFGVHVHSGARRSCAVPLTGRPSSSSPASSSLLQFTLGHLGTLSCHMRRKGKGREGTGAGTVPGSTWRLVSHPHLLSLQRKLATSWVWPPGGAGGGGSHTLPLLRVPGKFQVVPQTGGSRHLGP